MFLDYGILFDHHTFRGKAMPYPALIRDHPIIGILMQDATAAGTGGNRCQLLRFHFGLGSLSSHSGINELNQKGATSFRGTI
jgi:hypothetical protein